jgi:hypothetical protein
MENHKQSSSSAFWGGFGTGAGSGAMMVGILTAVSLVAKFALSGLGMAGAAGSLGIMAIPLMAVMITATGLYGGFMAMKRAKESGTAGHSTSHSTTRARSADPEITPMPMIAPAAAMDEAPEMTGTKWADRTGRSNSADRIQGILADGELSDKSRASAILAEREAATQNSTSIA